jgi:post-segregation antitoxin (ccd killing protein)
MNIIGCKYKIDLRMAKATLDIHSDTSLTFTIIEQNGKAVNISETVETKIIELRRQLFQVTWKEENGKTVTQIQDYENEIVYSNVTLPNGQFINLKGTIKQADDGVL